MKKKLIAAILTIAMLAVMAAGCSGGADKNAKDSGGADKDTFKIGVVFYSKDDALGQSVVSTINYAAEVLGNVEIEWNICGTEPTEQIAAVENLISSGCKGIMTIPMTDVVSQRSAEACEAAGVKLALCFRNISDDSIREQVESMDCYVGQCEEDEKGTAKEVVEYLVDQGYSKFGVGYLDPSNALVARNKGTDAGIEETKSEKLAEYTVPLAQDPQTHSSAIENFMSSYPSMEAVIIDSAAQGGGEAILSTIASFGSDLKMAAFDTFDGMKDGFDQGIIEVLVGGMYPDALFTFMALYNAVDGTPLSEEPVHLSQGYLLIRSADECEVYETYVADPNFRIYDEDAIKSMAGRYNKDLTLDKLQGLQDEFSMDYVMEQIQK